ncbi:MAG: flagellar type III secretion system pore protein FliP [Solirubrobacterales bacterium]
MKAQAGKRNEIKRYIVVCAAVLFLAAAIVVMVPDAASAAADTFKIPDINFSINNNPEGPAGTSQALQILGFLTVLAIAPGILIMMTSFTRIVVVLSFVRNALGTQMMPPNQLLLALAMFLTIFVMTPTFREVNNTALQPYVKGEITQAEFLDKGMKPMREFMLRQTREKDLALFIELRGDKRPKTYEEISTWAIIPAFAISELNTAFQIGFIIFVPFLVIDMVVSSALMSMGMLMLPPMMISLPFKILLFVLVDGWNLVIYSLVRSFNT